MNTPELRQIVADATPVLERAVARHIVYGNHPEELQLRGSVCGLASSLLGRYLAQKHDIRTDRHIAALDWYPTGDHVQMRHVVLTDQETGAIIDPSFSQFFGLVGLTQSTAKEVPELRSLYPTNKIAVIEPGSERLFGYKYSEYAARIAPQVKAHLGSRAIVPIPPAGLLLDASHDQIHGIYDAIWERGLYQSYPEQVDDEYVERMLDESLQFAE